MRYLFFSLLTVVSPWIAFSHGALLTDSRGLQGWRSDFSECRSEAINGHRPLVLVWGSEMCPHCKALCADLATNEVFQAWQKETGFIFCHVTGRVGKNENEIKLAKTFAATAGGTSSQQPSSFPYVCYYHKREGGTVVAASFTAQYAAEVMDFIKDVDSGASSNRWSNAAAAADAIDITPFSFRGNYTVQIPFACASSNALLRGDASLALRIRAGAPSSISYSATLPDGSSLTNTVPFRMEDAFDESGKTSKVVRVDVVGSTPYGTLRVPLKITPFGSVSWRNPSVPNRLPSVFVADGGHATYKHASGGKESELLVYGGFYRSVKSPKQLCDHFDLSPSLSLKVQAMGVSSERFGEVLEWPIGKVVAGKKTFTPAKKKSTFSLSFAHSDGTITGKGKIKFAGRTVIGEFKGIVLPGWIDCHCGTEFKSRPFASGLLAYKDYVKDGTNWVEVIRSVPFEMIAK